MGTGKGREAVTQYLGTDHECTICLEDVVHNDIVFRLTCNHVFHEECWGN